MTTYDIAILGATPAGCAAAVVLAKRKRRVVLIEAPAGAAESPLADWLPRGFFAIANLPKSLESAAEAAAFSRVVYHNADLTQSVEHAGRGAVGYFVQAGQLAGALKKAAVKAGAKVKTFDRLPRITLREDHAELVGDTSVRGKLLMIAMNRPRDIIGELALPVQNVPPTPMTVAALDIPLQRKGKSKESQTLAGAMHVVDTHERSDLGMFFQGGNTVHIRLISASSASGTRAEELSAMVHRLQRGGLLPPELPLARARGAVWHPPAGMALELETHVAKRCLLVGTAGGFAESIAGQTLYPSVRSALMAADIVAAALDRDRVQDEIMRFKTAWRKTLADYLRPPNTSLQMLLPLLFVNKQIVPKFTRALLLGENI